MFLKNWIVIVVLLAIGLALAWYGLRTTTARVALSPGVVPQGGTEDLVTAIAAIAGAITTLTGAIFGAAMKLIEYKKASLAVEEARIANEKARKELETG